MSNFILLPHTADLRIKITADSIDELFSSATDALCTVLTGQVAIEDEISASSDFTIESIDLSTLLIDFLNHVLYLSIMNSKCYKLDKIIHLNDNKLHFFISGFNTKSFVEDIKAVTYHDAEIIQSDELKYEVTIIIDI